MADTHAIKIPTNSNTTTPQIYHHAAEVSFGRIQKYLRELLRQAQVARLKILQKSGHLFDLFIHIDKAGVFIIRLYSPGPDVSFCTNLALKHRIKKTRIRPNKLNQSPG